MFLRCIAAPIFFAAVHAKIADASKINIEDVVGTGDCMTSACSTPEDLSPDQFGWDIRRECLIESGSAEKASCDDPNGIYIYPVHEGVEYPDAKGKFSYYTCCSTPKDVVESCSPSLCASPDNFDFEEGETDCIVPTSGKEPMACKEGSDTVPKNTWNATSFIWLYTCCMEEVEVGDSTPDLTSCSESACTSPDGKGGMDCMASHLVSNDMSCDAESNYTVSVNYENFSWPFVVYTCCKMGEEETVDSLPGPASTTNGVDVGNMDVGAEANTKDTSAAVFDMTTHASELLLMVVVVVFWS